MDGEYSLHPADYVVFLGTVVLSTGIGVIYGVRSNGSNTKENFFVGGRNMNFFPTAISLLVTFQSSIMMLGTPAEVYIYGTSVLLMGIGSVSCKFFGIFITVPLFRPLKLTSVYELIYTGIVIYGPAVAIQAVTGFNQWITILIITISGVIFTSWGGIKSVIWTDVFQATIMYTGIVVVIIKATSEAGGLSKVLEYATNGRRLDTFNFDPDLTIRHTVWTLYIPAFVRGCRYVFSQSTVQRVSAASSDTGATLVMAMMAPIDLILFTLVVFEGVALYAYFDQRDAEPLTAGIISNPNQIVPYAVLVLFHEYPGMVGLFLAALFAASLSTVSSSLSTMSIFIIEDFLQPFIGHIEDKKQMIYTRLTVVCLGVTACFFCVMTSFMTGSLMQICVSLVSATTGPLIGIFLLGCFFPSSTTKGVFTGVVTGSILCWILVLGQNFAPGVTKTPWLPLGNQTYCSKEELNLAAVSTFNNSAFNMAKDCMTNPDDLDRPFNIFNLSYNLTALIGALTTVTFGLISSHILGKNHPGDVNPQYFLPISDTWLIWLPAPVRRWIKRQGPQFTNGWKVRGSQQSTETESEEYRLGLDVPPIPHLQTHSSTQTAQTV